MHTDTMRIKSIRRSNDKLIIIDVELLQTNADPGMRNNQVQSFMPEKQTIRDRRLIVGEKRSDPIEKKHDRNDSGTEHTQQQLVAACEQQQDEDNSNASKGRTTRPRANEF